MKKYISIIMEQLNNNNEHSAQTLSLPSMNKHNKRRCYGKSSSPTISPIISP
jgi:hypothetical protein